MSTLTINRRLNGLISNPINIPSNPFVIKEGNQELFISSYLKRHPTSSPFSENLDVQNGVPTSDETTFDFVGFTLSPSEETDVTNVIIGFRDKVAYTTIEQQNIDNMNIIDEAIEQIGDFFDEDNIDDLVLPDFISMRNNLITEYETAGWANLDVGDRRILVGDWLIPNFSERIEIFPGGDKRQSIYKLFANRVSTIKSLEFTQELSEIADNFDEERLSLLLNRNLVDTRYKPELFVSRSNIASADANAVEVDIPIFSNVRTSSSLITVNSDTEAEFNRDATVDIGYSIQVNANGSTNHQVRGCVNGDNIDNQMRRDGRGRDTSTHLPIRVSFSQGDLITVKLNNQNAGGGAITAASGRSLITIKEVLEV